MRIDTAVSSLFATLARASSAPASATSDASSSAAASAATTESGKGVATLDFTNMTRLELVDWMNNEIRSGRLSLDDTTPLVGLALKISAKTLEPVDMATDVERFDFMTRLRDGIKGALWRGDEKEAEWLRRGLAVLDAYQGKLGSVDIRA